MFQEFTGHQYLMIDIANNFGLDKLTWNERLTWFDQNEHQLMSLVPQAEEPALFYAGAKAWADVLAGRPIGYMISLDATASGMQIMAALTGDRSAAQLCNVVDTGTRQDAYTTIYNLMLEHLGDTAKITRDDCKRAIMTSYYGSKAQPKRVFGEGELLALFYAVMEEVSPAAWELNETMLQLWQPDATAYNWILPDNFHAHIKVMDTVSDTVHFLNQPFEVTYKVNRPVQEGRSLGANMVHAIDGMVVREITRRCDYDPARINEVEHILAGTSRSTDCASAHDNDLVTALWDHYQQSGYLSARILDHLHPDNVGQVDRKTIWELLGSLPDKPFKVVSIHDCFRCLPHYGNDLRRQYNHQLELIARSDLLSVLIGQIIGQNVQIGKLDPTLHEDIAASNYALS